MPNTSKNYAMDMDINFLVLGETGIGKTSFIWNLVTHLKYDSLKSALKGEPDLLTSPPEPTTEVTCTRFHARYETFNAVDTPGLSGSISPERNVAIINDVVTHFSTPKHLNTVVFLLRPDVVRLRKYLKLNLARMFGEKFDVLRDNVLFVVVHEKNSTWKPEECSEALRSILEELGAACLLSESKANVLHCNRNVFNMFGGGDKLYRFEVASGGRRFAQVSEGELVPSCGAVAYERKQWYAATLQHEKVESRSDNWRESVKFCESFMARLNASRPMYVRCSTSEESIVDVVANIFDLLVDISFTLEDNLAIFEDSKNMVNAKYNNYYSNNGAVYTRLNIASFGNFVTVCNNNRCLTTSKIARSVFRQQKVCCKCTNVSSGAVLDECSVFRFPSNTCSKCDCPLSKHTAVRHMTVIRNETVPHDKVASVASVANEKSVVVNLLAAIAIFHRRTQPVDVYRELLQQKIEQDDRQPSPYKNLKLLYDEVLEQCKASGTNVTFEDLQRCIRELDELNLVRQMISPEFRQAFIRPVMYLEMKRHPTMGVADMHDGLETVSIEGEPQTKRQKIM